MTFFKITAFIIGLTILSSCGEPDRVNIITPDGSTSVSVMDFGVTTSMDPVPDGWYHRTFWLSSPMEISFVTHQDKPSIKLATDNSASMLFRHVDIPLDEYHSLNWDWFIEKGIESEISELTEEGDDHPARLFLSFEAADGTGHRMEIIWGNRELKAGDWKHLEFSEGRSFPHFVANGGPENTQRWHSEQVDMTEIYKELWGDPKGARLTDIALFCDTDGTGTQSIAYFSNIRVNKKSNSFIIQVE